MSSMGGTNNRDTDTAAKVDELREALISMRDLAMVAHNGDPWYAENEGIDVPAILEQARRALGEEPKS